MGRHHNLWLACFLLLTTTSGCERRDTGNPVNASKYDSFWLWAGVRPQPVLDQAKTVYILEGEVRASDLESLVLLRPETPEINHADIWMVVRVETLDLSPDVYRQIFARLERWSGKGNRLVGIQIDFDANTRSLGRYAIFLRDFRRRLPEKYGLSITGLLDWSANGDPAELAALSDVIDEAVFQVYQGRKTIGGYDRWLTKLDALPMAFRIGLVQGGEWTEPQSLPKNPHFKGYVVFLLNPAVQNDPVD
ncbi:DUF3142 domain-containing protein [Parasphingorhabdus halotolerans]|uniref:DUF3142 domain-containing protein n=1 Tax=Parasphingorhabdus halotolerans TaxID=2725558 RepID=A0A6H2DPS9_9SPHN|nr:DUF3142 domain-containing protein [Parasphingorhabdus halotolerans]QJB70672.1 DUF3142 domain-containing protein [Parasphingorhabdus halotolerans]